MNAQSARNINTLCFIFTVLGIVLMWGGAVSWVLHEDPVTFICGLVCTTTGIMACMWAVDVSYEVCTDGSPVFNRFI
jgi:hypothetical protein